MTRELLLLRQALDALETLDEFLSLEEGSDALLNEAAVKFEDVLPKLRAHLAAQPAPVPLQGGMDNNELLAAWQKKLPGRMPEGQELNAFAVGTEVGFEHAQNLERMDWDRVHHVLAKHGKHPGRTDDHLADVIDKALSAAPVPVPPGWIAVFDKMPPEDVPCWLYEKERGAWVGGWSSDSDGWLWHNCYGSQFLDTDGEWDSIDAEADDDYQPTHWMPLPPPPGIAASPEKKP